MQFRETVSRKGARYKYIELYVSSYVTTVFPFLRSF